MTISLHFLEHSLGSKSSQRCGIYIYMDACISTWIDGYSNKTIFCIISEKSASDLDLGKISSLLTLHMQMLHYHNFSIYVKLTFYNKAPRIH